MRYIGYKHKPYNNNLYCLCQQAVQTKGVVLNKVKKIHILSSEEENFNYTYHEHRESKQI